MEQSFSPLADDSPKSSNKEKPVNEGNQARNTTQNPADDSSPTLKGIFVVIKNLGKKINFLPLLKYLRAFGRKYFNLFALRLTQFKYISRFLTPREKIIIKCLLGIIFLNLFFLSINFFLKHRKTVPAYGGEYIEAMVGSPQFINPVIGVTSDVDKDLTRLVYSGLLKYNQAHKLIPDLASDYTVSDDGKIYTFYLRQNIFWHDGAPLTADDIIFTIKTIQDPEYQSPLLVSLKGVITEKIDDYTVKFSLQEPFAPFVSVLTVGILPKHLWAEITPQQFALAVRNIKPVGSGPYIFKSFNKNQSGEIKTYNLEANKNYYGQRPFIERITLKFYGSTEEAETALLNKQVGGISYLPKELKAQIEADPRIIFHSLRLPQYTAIFFNQNNNQFLKNKDVRQALAYSVNKEKILNDALSQEGEIIHGPILPNFIGYNPGIKKYEFDAQKTNDLLAKAGFTAITAEEYGQLNQKTAADSDSAENQENLAGETSSTTLSTQKTYFKKGNDILEINLITADQAELQKVAGLIQKSWQQIGIKVNLQIVPSAEIKETVQKRRYDAFIYGIITGFDPDPYPFWHSSQNQAPGLNLAVFANQEVDQILEDARKTTDEKARHDKYVHFQNILVGEIPAIFLYSPTYTYALNSKIKGFNLTHISQPADRFTNIEDWYIKTKMVFNW